ncbi:MAG: DUF3311 domain-containing protein [Deltaproteobacteria bacterium]|nr:DUF3311 domain-containing protein [Deltaproteobacteria bacterium]
MKNGYLLAGILIIIPIAVLAAVPLYDRVEPAFLGMPFFYWFQTLWLVLAAILYSAASKLISKEKGGGDL